MRRVVWWGGPLLAVCALVGTAVGAPAPGTEVVLLSGPSPFPADGCGQQGVNADAAGQGRVEKNAVERGQEQDISVVVNPADPSNVVAAWVQDAALGIVVASSRDGGRTFTRTVAPKLTVCNGGAAQYVLHARLAAAPDGTLYLTGETLDGFFPDPRSALATIPLSVSTDGGRSWSDPRFVPTPPGVAIGLDTLTAGPQGAVVAWHSPEPVATTYVSTTPDGGRTWSRATVPGGPPDALPYQRILLGAGGTQHVLTVEATVRGFFTGGLPVQEVLGEQRPALVSRTSRDAGATWSEPVEVAAGVPAQWAGGVVTASGAVVTTWLASGRDGCAAPLLSSSSSDGGRWSAPVVVTCDAVGSTPSLVARGDGTLAVATTSSLGGDVRRQLLHLSSDGGRSWSATQLGAPFQAPAAAGRYQETAAGGDAVYSVFVRANDAPGERSDAMLGVLRSPAGPRCRPPGRDADGAGRGPCRRPAGAPVAAAGHVR